MKIQALSSISGRISRITIFMPYSSEASLKRYIPLIKAFQPDVVVVSIICYEPIHNPVDQIEGHATEMFELASVDKKDRVIILRPNLDFGFTKWTQDPFQVLADETGKGKALISSLPRVNANFIVSQLSAGINLPVYGNRSLLEGGNLLIDNNTALLGQNVLVDNTQKKINLGLTNCRYFVNRLSMDEQDVRLELERLFRIPKTSLRFVGRQLNLTPSPIYQLNPIRTQNQPFFHLDLYLTWGIKQDGHLKRTILVARIRREGILMQSQDEIPENIQRIMQILDKLANSFSQQGHPVVRVDMVVSVGRPAGSFDHFFSYNNAQVQDYPGMSKAIIPNYYDPKSRLIPPELNKLFKQFDRLAFESFKEAGFNTIAEVKGELMYTSALDRGSVHCLTKVLDREYYIP